VGLGQWVLATEGVSLAWIILAVLGRMEERMEEDSTGP
jgi:hypothetical protein